MRLTTLTFGKRLRICLLVGAAMGVIASLRTLVALVLFLVTSHRSEPILPVLRGLLAYVLGGVLGGGVVAITAPLLRWIGGAYVVGVLATLPTMIGFALNDAIDSPPINWPLVLEAGLAYALFAGGALGIFEWLKEDRHSYKLVHVWLFAALSSALAWFIGLHWTGRGPATIAAILLFLIPVMIALMVTFNALDQRT